MQKSAILPKRLVRLVADGSSKFFREQDGRAKQQDHYGCIFLWLFAAVVVGALTVVAHADELAAILGEPYGTLILTLSVGSIEIMTIGAVMLTGDANPTLARDTMFSVVMIVMNGLIGLALLLGGLRYREQEYNFPGVSAYLGLIITLGTLGMILPNYTTTTLKEVITCERDMDGNYGFLCFIVQSASNFFLAT